MSRDRILPPMDSPADSPTEQTKGETEYDIVVVGGGLAGVFAAIGSALYARRVLLVEQQASLGGQGTRTGERQFCGDVEHVNQPFSEILDSLREHGALGQIVPTRGGTTFNGEVLAFLLQERLLTAGSQILFHTSLVDAERANGRVVSLVVHNKSGLQRIRARYVIDCTGDGDLAAVAGFETKKGGRVFAPDGSVREGLELQLPMSLCFYMEDTGEKVPPILPAGCPRWSDDQDLPMTTVVPISPHTIFVKMKVIDADVTDGTSYSRAEIRARRQMMGLVYHLQTKGYRGVVYDTYTLRFVSPGLGIREGRRIVGEYVLTEDDVRRGRHFPDAVAVGSYQIDYHWPDLLERAGTGITDQVPPYQIPYRCLMPKGGENILVAGRCVSGDQMAMASFRVMTTCAQTGMAAGIACGLAAREGVRLPDLPICTLREAIRKHGQLLDTSPYRRFRRQKRKVRELVLGDGSPFEAVGASTLLELEDSETIVAWSGQVTGESSAAIWMARRGEEAWGPPEKIIQEGKALHRDPALLRDQEGAVHLCYVVEDMPQNPRLRVVASHDLGRTWGQPRTLAIGEQPATSACSRVLVLLNGDWIAPLIDASEGHLAAFAHISEDCGEKWTKGKSVRLRDEYLGGEAPHPPLPWESGPGNLHMLVRSTAGKAFRCDSRDSGRTWSPGEPVELPELADGMDLAAMGDGELALMHGIRQDNGKSGATRMAVSLSEDDGNTWPIGLTLEDADLRIAGSISDPAVVRSPEGISATYTKGRNIVFWRLSVEHIGGL